MKIKTHPKHMDLGGLSEGSSYSKTMGRFDFILQNKLGVNHLKKTNLNNKAINTQNLKLNTKEISQNVKLKSANPSIKIDRYFNNTPLKNMGKEFEKAQEKYGVNAYFLAAMASLESANGTSQIAKDKNNLFGFGAYDDSPYQSAKSFASYPDSIDKVAKYLSEEYLHENGSYYTGDSIENINQNYATDKEWHNKLEKIIDKIQG